ncbi:MAG: nitroreductase [Alphaproteobacteria bacterium]|nr:nitroreductase [Alphaproteobacteria bacterium]
MPGLEALLSRRSLSPRQLIDPGPTGDDLAAILDAAVRAPDHGDLRPWRFVLVEGEARTRLGEVFAQARALREPGIGEAELEKERRKPLRAPLLMLVAAVLDPANTKIRIIDRVLAAGAAAMNVMNAAHMLGYAGMWLTGNNSHDPNVKRALGLDPHDEIVGSLYLGTPAGIPKPKDRPRGLDLAMRWERDLTPAGAAPLTGTGRFNF